MREKDVALWVSILKYSLRILNDQGKQFRKLVFNIRGRLEKLHNTANDGWKMVWRLLHATTRFFLRTLEDLISPFP